jgi:hypothetical protein
MMNHREKIAIIGGGIAGLTAGYLLHPGYDITLFEKSGRAGGNAFTLITDQGDHVDIAAAVFGRTTYTNFLNLLTKLNIDLVGSFSMNPFAESSLGVGFCDLETNKGTFYTPGLKGLISQRFKILSPTHLRSLFRVRQGFKKAAYQWNQGLFEGVTVEEAIARIPELQGEAKLIFVGFLCLISSMQCNDLLNAPAGFFIEKLQRYDDLLPPRVFWSLYFPKNRTASYIDALSKPFQEKIVLNSNIKRVKRRERDSVLIMDNGTERVFDKVIFACNADQALALLDEPSSEEKRLLGAWKYTEGRVVVHRDHSRFPKRELMEGYTFLYRETDRYIQTSVSGSLWVLPGMSRKCDLISTQHPNFPIREDLIVFQKVFRTPLFDFNSCRTIDQLPTLNGVRNTFYCGSHFGFGLHEDAVTSAIRVAKKLGLEF